MINTCNLEIQKFCDSIGAYDFHMTEKRKFVQWEFVTNMSRVNIVYLKKGSVLHAPSTLYARIFPHKNQYISFFPHELKMYSDDTAFLGPYIYPYIENETRMKERIASLLLVVEESLSLAGQMVMDAEHFQSAVRKKEDEMIRIFQIKEKSLPDEDDEYYDDLYTYLYQSYEETIILPRFTSQDAPFLYIVNGEYKKALRTYGKWEAKGTLTTYERKLYQLLIDCPSKVESLFKEYRDVAALFSYASPNAEGKRILLGVLLSFVGLSVIYCGLNFLIQGVLSVGATYWLGVPWTLGLSVAGGPAIFLGIALRRQAYTLFRLKEKAKIRATERLVNGRGVSIFAYIVSSLFLVDITVMWLSILFFDNVGFYEDKLTYYEEAFIPSSENYREISYDDIEAIYMIEGRYNDYDEYIDRASYVLYFQDGTMLDLDGYTSVKNTEKNILPIITPHAGEPVTLKSDRELP